MATQKKSKGDGAKTEVRWAVVTTRNPKSPWIVTSSLEWTRANCKREWSRNSDSVLAEYGVTWTVRKVTVSLA